MYAVDILEADLHREEHQRAVVELLTVYAADPMGIASSLPGDTGSKTVAGLRGLPTSVVYLAYSNNQPIGLAVCFLGFSTFAAKPLLNIHDLVVHPEYRRRGIGSRLLAHVEQDARDRGCCKVTLEVRRDNAVAQSVYRRSGFEAGTPPYEFWTKSLDGQGLDRPSDT